MPASFSWPLIPSSPNTDAGSGANSTGVGTNATPQPRRALRGVLRPFQRDGISDVATAVGDDLLVSQVQGVLGNDTGYPWRHQQRTKLFRLLNQRNNPGLSAFARFYCAEALATWLPTVRVLGVDATRGARSIELVVTVTRRDDIRTPPRSLPVPISIPILAG